MTSPRMMFAVRLACYLCLASLGLMAWSLVHPTPIPIILAMSMGQILGTLAFLVFLAVVASDLRKSWAARAAMPPSERSGSGLSYPPPKKKK